MDKMGEMGVVDEVDEMDVVDEVDVERLTDQSCLASDGGRV